MGKVQTNFRLRDWGISGKDFGDAQFLLSMKMIVSLFFRE